MKHEGLKDVEALNRLYLELNNERYVPINENVVEIESLGTLKNLTDSVIPDYVNRMLDEVEADEVRDMSFFITKCLDCLGDAEELVLKCEAEGIS